MPTSCRHLGLWRHIVPPFLSNRCSDEATHRPDATSTGGYTSRADFLPPFSSSWDAVSDVALRSSATLCLSPSDTRAFASTVSGGISGQTLAFAMEPPHSRPAPREHVGVFSIPAMTGFCRAIALGDCLGLRTGCCGGLPYGRDHRPASSTSCVRSPAVLV